MSQPLPAPLAPVGPWLDHYGYAAVGLLILAEGVGLPTPAVTVLVAASAYAGAGHLSLVAVLSVAIVAASAGDNLGYALGHGVGRAVMVRWGRYVGITEQRVRRGEAFFTRRGGAVVVIARFIDGLRQTNGWITGALGMPWRRYLALDALGAVCWVGVWASLGYLAGDHLDTIYRLARRYESFAVVTFAVVVAGILLWHLRPGRRRQDRA